MTFVTQARRPAGYRAGLRRAFGEGLFAMPGWFFSGHPAAPATGRPPQGLHDKRHAFGQLLSRSCCFSGWTFVSGSVADLMLLPARPASIFIS
jgi:hypothetical protein